MNIEEAKKEIQYAKSFGTSGVVPRWEAIDTVLNELEKKDKIISQMAKYLEKHSTAFTQLYGANEEDWKEYFYKKVSDNK